MRDRHDMSDEQWALIKPHLPASSAGRAGRPWSDHRAVINAVLWRTRAGAAWRDLPAEYGPWKTAYNRHRRRAGRYLPVMRSDGPALMPVFRSQHQAELLMWLLLHPEQEYGVTEMAVRLEVPLSTLHREVIRLDGAGLVASRTQGRNRLIRADLDHPAAKALTRLT